MDRKDLKLGTKIYIYKTLMSVASHESEEGALSEGVKNVRESQPLLNYKLSVYI